MIDHTSSNGPHLADALLIQYLDRELTKAAATRVAAHLENCPSCRGRAEEYRSCAYSLQQYREISILRQDDPPRSFDMFYARLQWQERELVSRRDRGVGARISRWVVSVLAKQRSIVAPSVLVYVMPFVAMAALCAGWWALSRPLARVSAKEALTRAEVQEAQSLQSYRNPVVHQKITVRAHGRDAGLEIWRAVNDKKVRTDWDQATQVGSELNAIYRSNDFDIGQPLSAAKFSAWRKSLSDRREQVTTDSNSDLIQISTETDRSAPGQILHVVFVLRESDWHPIRQTIYVQTQSGTPDEYQIQETGYAVLPMEQVPLAMFASEARAGAADSLTVRRATEPVAEVSEMRLLESEVRLDETLHRIGADLREAPSINITGKRVEFDLWAEDKERQAQILKATQDIPLVMARIEAVPAHGVAAPSNQLLLPAEQPSYSTTPPLTKALWEYAGGVTEANNYLAAVSDAERRVLNETAALDRLARDYPLERWQGMPPNLQHSIDSIAADHVTAIEHDMSAYFDLLSPVVDAMLARQNIRIDIPSTTAGCASWRSVAPRLHENLPKLQIAFQRTFVEDHVERPMGALSANALLTEASMLRGEMRAELAQMCEPSLHSTTHISPRGHQ